MRSQLGVLAVLVVVLASSTPAQKTLGTGQADFATGTYQLARSATVKILSSVPRPAPPTFPGSSPTQPASMAGQPLGSGVWISDDGYIATCYHVVPVERGDSVFIGQAGPEVYTAQLSMTGLTRVMTATVVYRDKDADVAILKPETNWIKNPPMPAVILGTKNITGSQASSLSEIGDVPKIGDAVVLAGFPLDGSTMYLQSGNFAGIKSIPVVSLPQPPALDKGIRFFLSLVANHGDSGAPVLSSDGKLVGLLEGGLLAIVADSQSQVVAIPQIKIDQQGAEVPDQDGKIHVQYIPLIENSGISYVVPARFVYSALDSLRSENSR